MNKVWFYFLATKNILIDKMAKVLIRIQVLFCAYILCWAKSGLLFQISMLSYGGAEPIIQRSLKMSEPYKACTYFSYKFLMNQS